jgi:glycosyltransferase involved in cell wall biosynthesis
MVDLPRITVVTPSYQQGRWIERTIRSVLDQGYPDLEFVVLDGGSTDETLEIIGRYADRLTRWSSAPDDGQAAAIDEGWRASTGEILTWLNSDDFYVEGTLEIIGRWFGDHPDRGFVYGRCRLVDPDGAPLGITGSPFSRRGLLLSHQMIPQPAAFLRRSLVQRAGFVNPQLRYSMDYDLFVRASAIERPVFLPRILAEATIHPDAKTRRDAAPAMEETRALRRRHARGVERLLVKLQPLSSAIYHRLPEGLRGAIARVRPVRIRRS